MNQAVVWYQSRALWGSIAGLIIAVLSALHVLPGLTKDQLTSFLLLAAPAAIAFEGRLTATKTIAATPARAAAASTNPSANAPIDPPPAVPAPSQEHPMSIIVEIEDDVMSFLKAAGKAVETFALSEGQKLVAAAKETFVGTAVTNIISALESNTMSGAEKMETVVTAAVPLIEKLVASGGIGALVTSVEDFALEFCQSAYNDFKAAAEQALDGAAMTATDATAQAA